MVHLRRVSLDRRSDGRSARHQIHPSWPIMNLALPLTSRDCIYCSTVLRRVYYVSLHVAQRLKQTTLNLQSSLLTSTLLLWTVFYYGVHIIVRSSISNDTHCWTKLSSLSLGPSQDQTSEVVIFSRLMTSPGIYINQIAWMC